MRDGVLRGEGRKERMFPVSKDGKKSKRESRMVCLQNSKSRGLARAEGQGCRIIKF
jgi:hypothetical protein